jgi:carbamate kinase
VTPTELQQYRFAAGSMAPKIEAASSFVRSTRKRASIGALTDGMAIVAGTAGTAVVNAKEQ